MMKFKYDIFISYAQTLAEMKDPGQASWSLLFCDYLSLIMDRLYDKKPVILTHDDLRSRRNIEEESSRDVFSNTAVFIVILTPEYIKSKEYLEELEEIHQVSMHTKESQEKSQPRILKVMTLPLPSQEQPKFLRSELGYHFFEINRYNKKPVTYAIEGKNGPEQKFWSKLVDLAYDVSNMLDSMSPHQPGKNGSGNKPGIFLAETTFDQVENRDMLKRELQHLGFNIMPFTSLPEEAEKAKFVIECHLKQSILAVHLLGGWYGDFIKNSKYSLIDFQIKTVKEYINRKENTSPPDQVIWIPGDLKPTDQRQTLYLKRIKRDEAQFKTEIIETSFEVFKTALITKLNELVNPTPVPVAEKNKLYAIYEKNVEDKMNGYLDLIRSKGYELLETHHNNEAYYSISEHIKNLLMADAVLIYKGNSTMEWLNSKIRDLVKTPGYGKSKPFRAVEIISPEQTADKSLLFLKNVPINWDEEINNDVINHFLEQLVKK